MDFEYTASFAALAGAAHMNASRLQTVTDGTNNATYGYLANSPLVSQITLKSTIRSQSLPLRVTSTPVSRPKPNAIPMA